MFICCSPSSYNECETRSTLLFGQRTKTIKNVVVVNEELTVEEWKRRYEREKLKIEQQRVLINKLMNELKSQHPTGDFESLSSSLLTSVEDTDIVSSQKETTDKEIEHLYAKIEEMEDELYSKSVVTEGLRKELLDKTKIISLCNIDNERLQDEMNRLESHNATTKNEVNEVLQVLEDLSEKYDVKNQEVLLKEEEFAKLNDKLISENEELRKYQKRLANLIKEMESQDKVFSSLLSSLEVDMAKLLQRNPRGKRVQVDWNETSTTISGYISSLKVLITNLRATISNLEDEIDVKEDSERELKNSVKQLKFELDQRDSQIARLEEEAKLSSEQCSSLMISLDCKTELLNRVASSELITNRKLREKEIEQSGLIKSADVLQNALRTQLESEREMFHQKLSALQKELADSICSSNQIRSEKDSATMLLQRSQVECANLKNEMQDFVNRSRKLSQDESAVIQARRDLVALEDKIALEMASLKKLRSMVVEGMTHKLKRVEVSQQTQMHEQQNTQVMLELETITKTYKQLTKDNADLRAELPQLEARLKSTAARVKTLEASITNAKEASLRTTSRYLARIKDAKHTSNQSMKERLPNIVRTVVRPKQIADVAIQSLPEQFKPDTNDQSEQTDESMVNAVLKSGHRSKPITNLMMYC